MSGNPMGLSPEALAMLAETSRQMNIREAEMKAEWDFGDLAYDDPVFEKIKRGVRKFRREG